jgi:lambda repressor-like predicted transcriptional regulator
VLTNFQRARIAAGLTEIPRPFAGQQRDRMAAMARVFMAEYGWGLITVADELGVHRDSLRVALRRPPCAESLRIVRRACGLYVPSVGGDLALEFLRRRYEDDSHRPMVRWKAKLGPADRRRTRRA